MMSAASINGVTIGYDDAGTGENVLVLVHGHPFDRSMWRMQVGRISRQDAKTPRLQRVIDERERFERSEPSERAERVMTMSAPRPSCSCSAALAPLTATSRCSVLPKRAQTDPGSASE